MPENPVSLWAVGDVYFSRLHVHPDIEQNHQLPFAEPDIERVVVSCFDQLAVVSGAHGEAHITTSSDVYIWPYRGHARFECGHAQANSAYIPVERLGYQPSANLPVRRFSASSAIGKIIRHTLLGTIGSLGSAHLNEIKELTELFCGMVGALPLATDSQDFAKGENTARNGAIRTYILANVRNPSLNVNDICQTFEISRASLYRLFRHEGGVARFITELRLKRAYADLLQSDTGNRNVIATIATRYGFSDAGSFSRSFRSHFGIAPSRILTAP